MKKLFVILVAAFFCFPAYAGTPKEYFEAADGVWQFGSDLNEMSYSYATNEGVRDMIDSCVSAMHDYVYNEVLPTKEPNSLEAADVLFHWLDFSYFLPEEERREVAQRIKAIVLPIEGKSKRYTAALDYEIGSWEELWGFMENIQKPVGDDTIQTVNALFDDRIACARVQTRPVDKEYLGVMKDYAYWLCRTQYSAEFTSEEDEYMSYNPELILRSEYHYFAALWRDLLNWDSISKEEYSYLCDSLIFHTGVEFDDESWRCLNATSYYRYISYSDYVDINLTHEQITKRMYGEKSEEYLKSADLFLDALRSASYDYIKRHDGEPENMHYMERAQSLCEEMLQSGILTTDSAYYWWQLYAYQCQLSAEGPTKKLGKQIDQMARKVLERSKQLQSYSAIELYNQYLVLQVNYALMTKDYKRAEKILAERWKQLPSIPENRWSDEGKYITALNLLEPCAKKYVQVYMLKGNYDKAFHFFNVYSDLIGGLVYQEPQTEEEKQMIANEMNNSCYFPDFLENPYTWLLQKRLEDQLFKWSGFRPE